MKNQTKRLSLVFNFQLLLFILVGVILIAFGNAIDLHIWKISIGEALAHIGFLILIIGTLHNLYEFYLRKEFQSEIANSVLGNSHIHQDGIIDSTLNSKEIREDYFLTSRKFIVSLGYNKNFISRHSGQIAQRSKNKMETILVHYTPDGEGVKYLSESGTGGKSIPQILGQLIAAIDKNSDIDNDFVTFVGINTVLHYAFIYTDNFIWIKFYANSIGIKSSVPAIKINCETPLYHFFEKDILDLIDQNKDNPNTFNDSLRRNKTS